MKFKLKTEYYWFIIFALAFISYQLVQDQIRPNYSGNQRIIKYFLGIAPNFFPSIGIPALFVVLIPSIFKKNKSNRWFVEYKHLTANILSLIGLLSWEFIQLSTTKGRFDWNDVLWTFFGALIFHLIWVLTPIKFKQ